MLGHYGTSEYPLDFDDEILPSVQRESQSVLEPYFEAGGIAISQGVGEPYYEAGMIRISQGVVELEHEAGAIRISQGVIELLYVPALGRAWGQVIG